MIFVKQLTVISYLGEQHRPQSYHTEQGPGAPSSELSSARTGAGERRPTYRKRDQGVADMPLVDLKWTA